MNRRDRRAAAVLRRKGGMHDKTTQALPFLNVERSRATAEGLKDGDVVRYNGSVQRYIVRIVNDGWTSGQDLADRAAAEARGIKINICM